MHIGLPPAPPPFRLADAAESRRTMAAAGFADVWLVDVPAVFECRGDEVMEILEKSTERLTMVLPAQSSAAIHAAICQKLATFITNDALRLPLPAILVSGIKCADDA